MIATALDIRPIDLRNAQPREYAALCEFWNAIQAERLPDDPPTTREEREGWWRNPPEHRRVSTWAAWDEDRVVAAADAEFEDLPENRHLAFVHVAVLAERRRRGLARELLRLAVEVPRRAGRSLVIGGTSSRIPAGEALMERLGAERGLHMRVSQLELDRLDRGLLRRWIDGAPARGGGFTVGFWDAEFPEERLEAIARLMEVMNTAPRGTLQVEDERVTAEQVRQWETAIRATGLRRVMAYALAPDGRLAGFTTTGWHASRPERLDQWGTGVWPEFRGQGLGRWLKAAMLERALADYPGLRRVRTGNAFVNRSMLSINDELGFEDFYSSTDWQVPTERILEYVARGATGG